MKAFADGKSNFNKNTSMYLSNGKKHCGKGENAGYQHFLIFPQSFQKAFSPKVSKVGIVCERVNAGIQYFNLFAQSFLPNQIITDELLSL